MRGRASELQRRSDSAWHHRHVDRSVVSIRCRNDCGQMLEQTRQNSQQFVWDAIQSAEEMGSHSHAGDARIVGRHSTCRRHRSAILELCRVAREVGIFPLLALDGRTSPCRQGSHTGQKPPQRFHDRSPAFTTKNRAMIAEVCSQPCVSACSCLRPSRVSL